MADHLQQRLSRQEFLELAERAGFDLSEADLAQLTRRNLVRPWQEPAQREASFHRVHLFLLVRYFQAVRPTRHPWATVSPELTLQDINQEARLYHDLVGELVTGEEGPDAEWIGEICEEMRAYAAKNNPFGPLASVAGLLGAAGRAELRGAGMLYVELLELADALEAHSASKRAALPDDVVSSDRDQPADEAIPTQKIELDEEPEPSENPFTRQNSEVTARTQDLQSRLDRLRSQDKEIARERSQSPTHQSPVQRDGSMGTADAVAAADEQAGGEQAGGEQARPENLHARIEELNRLRETYLAEQRWQDLADLYEDGIELFVDANERQQVFLTLAMLYEVKLDQMEPAFDRFVAAYLEAGSEQAKAKAFEGLQRVGRQPSVQPRYIGFLEDQLARDGLADAHRSSLQRLLALALHGAGQSQRAFFTYTAFLAEAGAEQVDERALDDLEKLAGSVDSEELGDFYADLFSHRLPDDVFEPMAIRAARHHADRGEVGLAMEYYERVLERFDDHEVAFHSLAQLYEDAGRLARLVELYKAKIAKLGDAAPASLGSELARIQQMTQAPTPVE